MKNLGLILWMNLLIIIATDIKFFTFFLILEVVAGIWLYGVYMKAKKDHENKNRMR